MSFPTQSQTRSAKKNLMRRPCVRMPGCAQHCFVETVWMSSLANHITLGSSPSAPRFFKSVGSSAGRLGSASLMDQGLKIAWCLLQWPLRAILPESWRPDSGPAELHQGSPSLWLARSFERHRVAPAPSEVQWRQRGYNGYRAPPTIARRLFGSVC